jgi:hypothetical protein
MISQAKEFNITCIPNISGDLMRFGIESDVIQFSFLRSCLLEHRNIRLDKGEQSGYPK